MTHDVTVVTAPDKHLTLRALVGLLLTTAWDRALCVRHGHDAVQAGRQRFCRRCLGTLRP